MSTLWAGAGAALVGAVVGGSFTALAARMQAASSLRAINYELQQSFAHERQQRKNEITFDGLTRLQNAAVDLVELMDEIFEKHKDCNGICTRGTLPITGLESSARQFERLNYLYNYDSLGFEVWDLFNAIIRDLAVKDSVEYVGKWLLKAAREDPRTANKPGVCNYQLAADYLTYLFMDVIADVGKALNALT